MKLLLVLPELVLTVALIVTELAEVTVDSMVFEVVLVVWTNKRLDLDVSLFNTMFLPDLLFVRNSGATESFFLPAGLTNWDFDLDRVIALVRGGLPCTASMRYQA